MRPQHSSSLSPWNIGGHRLDGPPTMAASHALPYGTLWKTRARIRRVKIGPQEREGFINRRSLRFSFLFFFVLGIPRDKGRDQFNFSLAGWIDGVEGIERRIEPGSLATSVFVFHPEATFTNDAASSWYFQGIIENRIFPRIAVLLRGKMDIVRIFNIAYTEDFSLWISFQFQGLISQKYYPFTRPFAHNLPKIPLPGEKTLFGFPAKSINRTPRPSPLPL